MEGKSLKCESIASVRQPLRVSSVFVQLYTFNFFNNLCGYKYKVLPQLSTQDLRVSLVLASQKDDGKLCYVNTETGEVGFLHSLFLTWAGPKVFVLIAQTTYDKPDGVIFSGEMLDNSIGNTDDWVRVVHCGSNFSSKYLPKKFNDQTSQVPTTWGFLPNPYLYIEVLTWICVENRTLNSTFTSYFYFCWRRYCPWHQVFVPDDATSASTVWRTNALLFPFSDLRSQLFITNTFTLS